jgi:hypothetical protein
MATTKQVQLCCISIGYQDLLMPADKGMKVLELLQSAVSCKRTYEAGYAYTAEDQPTLGLELVKASQVRMPEGSIAPSPRPVRRLTKG